MPHPSFDINQLPLADRFVVVSRSDEENPVAICRTPVETLDDLYNAVSRFMQHEVMLGTVAEDSISHLAVEALHNLTEILGVSVRDSRVASGSSLEWQFVLAPAELLPPPTNLN